MLGVTLVLAHNMFISDVPGRPLPQSATWNLRTREASRIYSKSGRQVLARGFDRTSMIRLVTGGQLSSVVSLSRHCTHVLSRRILHG